MNFWLCIVHLCDIFELSSIRLHLTFGTIKVSAVFFVVGQIIKIDQPTDQTWLYYHRKCFNAIRLAASRNNIIYLLFATSWVDVHRICCCCCSFFAFCHTGNIVAVFINALYRVWYSLIKIVIHNLYFAHRTLFRQKIILYIGCGRICQWLISPFLSVAVYCTVEHSSLLVK